VSVEEIIKDAKRRQLIASDATAADVKDAWSKLANHCLLDIKPMMKEFTELSDKLSEAGIAIVSRESCQDDTLAEIKQYAIDNKADAILRANGVERAIYALYEGVEKPLLDREEQARKKVEAVKSKIEEMRTKLERFHENARDILEPLHSNAPDRQLAEDFIDKVLIPAIEKEAAGTAAKRIIEQVGFFDRIFNMFDKFLGGEDNVKKEIQKILSEEMRKAVTFRAIGWGKDVDLGKSRILKDTLLKTVNRIRKRLEEIWNEQDSALIISLPPMPTDPNINVTMDTDKKLAEMGDANTISNLGVNVGIIVAISTVACVLPVIGPIFTIVASSIVIFIREFILDSQEQRIMKVKNKIIEGTKLLARGSAEREQAVMELMDKTTSTPRKAYLKIFQTALQAQTDAFESQSKTAVADLDKSEAERERIVRDCNHIRTQEIEPLRKKLQVFREEILKVIKNTRKEE
jgi:hypothetical protein